MFRWLCIAFLIGFTQSKFTWPLPQFINTGEETYVLYSSQFSFTSNINSNLLNNAFSRYQKLIFYANETQGSGDITKISVVVQNDNETLQLGIDESYSLDVSAPTVTLKANNVFGALRGLETFSQLVAEYTIESTPIQISDFPRFAHRGLLIDSARHYLPIQTILNAIDALAYNKMNVLHWHIIDAESFPMESQSFPELSKGAWNPRLVYTQEQASQVVKYAYERGIRVVAEFDTPGHSASWGKGYPHIVATCPDYSTNINNVPLNPTMNFTYDVVSGFLGEMSKIFMDDYIHTGGDEVVYDCWGEDNQILNWMAGHHVTSFDELMQIYEDQLWGILSKQGKKVLAWEEIFNLYNLENLPKDIIIEVWKDEPTLLSVAQAGVQGILAYGWYLDHLSELWSDFYNNEPFQSSGWTPELESYILGGEASAWGEQVNYANFDQTVWPRTSGTAERLWSSISDTNVTDAQIRITDHICRMNRRGIMADPIDPGFCM